jgi:ATP-binding cassette, subfamily B, bacterial MsbA
VGLPLGFFERRKTGEITSRLTSDIATVQSAVSQAVAQFINQGDLARGRGGRAVRDQRRS